MQVTRIDKRNQNTKMRFAVVTIVLLAIVGIGSAVAVIIRNDEATSISNVPAFVEPKTSTNVRSAEMNALPEVAANRSSAYQQYRFREINMLPEAAPAPIVAFERWRFLEVNRLPGDGAPLVAPFSDQSGVPH